MQNEVETGSTKSPRRWTPPRGVRLLELADRPDKPYAVQWRETENGKRVSKTKSFETKEAQVEFAKARAREMHEHGIQAPRLDTDEAREWRAFRSDLGEGVTLADVLRCWRRFGAQIVISGPTVSEAIEKYFALRTDEKSWSKDTERHARTHLRRFAERFSGRRLGELEASEVREWLFGRQVEKGTRIDVLTDDDGQPIGAHGIRDHRKNVSTFCAYAVRENWGIKENPLDAIKPPKTEDGDPVVIPLRDAFQFFKANRDERVIGRVALEAFGAVRYTTAGKLEKSALNFDGCGIRMAAKIHKSGQKDGRTRYRQGQPDNLWAWLKHAPDSCWEMTPLNYREAKRMASINAKLRPLENASKEDAAKIESLRNIWRHSFISYHLARFKSLPLTQYLAQHASPRQTEDYEGTADEKHAARYFMITPEAVLLTWEEFLALPIPALTTTVALPPGQVAA